MFTKQDDHTPFSVVRCEKIVLNAQRSLLLRQLVFGLLDEHSPDIIFDFNKARHFTASGLAGLLELVQLTKTHCPIAVTGLSKKILNQIERLGLGDLLPHYQSSKEAVASPDFQAMSLSNTRAVMLCAGKGTRMAPLSWERPKPALELLGRSLCHRICDKLSGFGINDVIVNPGHLGPELRKSLPTHPSMSIHFAPEGRYVGGHWHAEPKGSASTLLHLQEQHWAFDDDFLVLCGDALFDLNLADFMKAHKESGAELSVAARHVPASQTHKYGIICADPKGRITGFQEKPPAHKARSNLASVGIYAVSPRALAGHANRLQQDIAKDLIPKLMARGAHLHVHHADFQWHDMGCPRDYFKALEAGLNGDALIRPFGTKQKDAPIWVEEGAEISAKADITGPCFVGAHARIEANAKIKGPVIIGAHCRIEPNTVLQRCVITPNTLVQSGTWVDGMIASGQWAIAHDFADGTKVSCDPIPGVLQDGAAVQERILRKAG